MYRVEFTHTLSRNKFATFDAAERDAFAKRRAGQPYQIWKTAISNGRRHTESIASRGCTGAGYFHQGSKLVLTELPLSQELYMQLNGPSHVTR